MNAEPAGSAADTSATTEITEPAATTEKQTPDPQPNKPEGKTPATDERSARRVAALIGDNEGEEEAEPEPAAEKTETEDKRNAELHRAEGDEEETDPGRPDGKTATTKEKPTGVEEPPAERAKPEDKGAQAEELTDDQKKSWPAEALERIHKVAAQRNAARDQVTELTRQLQGARTATRSAPTAADPLADVTSLEELEKAVQECDGWIEFAELHPDGAEDVIVGYEADGKTPIKRDLTAQDIINLKVGNNRILRQFAPRKAQMLQEQGLHEQVAKATLPAMFEEGTDANRFYQFALRDIPGFRSIPGAPNMIKWGWMGRMVDLAGSNDAELLKQIGADKPEIQAAIKTIRSWIGLQGGAAKPNGNGKNGVVPSNKAKPFLQKPRAMAPELPSTRTSAKAEPGSKAEAKERTSQLAERVESGEGEEVEVDLIESLRSGSRAKEAPLV